jgi:hypothetical protein
VTQGSRIALSTAQRPRRCRTLACIGPEHSTTSSSRVSQTRKCLLPRCLSHLLVFWHPTRHQLVSSRPIPLTPRRLFSLALGRPIDSLSGRYNTTATTSHDGRRARRSPRRVDGDGDGGCEQQPAASISDHQRRREGYWSRTHTHQRFFLGQGGASNKVSYAQTTPTHIPHIPHVPHTYHAYTMHIPHPHMPTHGADVTPYTAQSSTHSITRFAALPCVVRFATNPHVPIKGTQSAPHTGRRETMWRRPTQGRVGRRFANTPRLLGSARGDVRLHCACSHPPRRAKLCSAGAHLSLRAARGEPLRFVLAAGGRPCTTHLPLGFALRGPHVHNYFLTYHTTHACLIRACGPFPSRVRAP